MRLQTNHKPLSVHFQDEIQKVPITDKNRHAARFLGRLLDKEYVKISRTKPTSMKMDEGDRANAMLTAFGKIKTRENNAGLAAAGTFGISGICIIAALMRAIDNIFGVASVISQAEALFALPLGVVFGMATSALYRLSGTYERALGIFRKMMGEAEEKTQ